MHVSKNTLLKCNPRTQSISESTVANVTSPADQSRCCCSSDWVGSKFYMPIPASCMWELILTLTILELTAFWVPPAVTKINFPPASLPVQNFLGNRGYVFLVHIHLWWHRSQHGCNRVEAFPGKKNSLACLFLIQVNSVFLRFNLTLWLCIMKPKSLPASQIDTAGCRRSCQSRLVTGVS